MSNFKSGSGNLDFGGGGDKRGDRETTGGSDSAAEREPDRPDDDPDAAADDPDAAADDPDAEPPAPEYPYFVRRSNVGDERDTRLELHVRDKVTDGEAAFRNELAERLGTNEVSKTDAREFALLVAFQHPDRVAELMREEGFGAFD